MDSKNSKTDVTNDVPEVPSSQAEGHVTVPPIAQQPPAQDPTITVPNVVIEEPLEVPKSPDSSSLTPAMDVVSPPQLVGDKATVADETLGQAVTTTEVPPEGSSSVDPNPVLNVVESQGISDTSVVEQQVGHGTEVQVSVEGGSPQPDAVKADSPVEGGTTQQVPAEKGDTSSEGIRDVGPSGGASTKHADTEKVVGKSGEEKAEISEAKLEKIEKVEPVKNLVDKEPATNESVHQHEIQEPNIPPTEKVDTPSEQPIKDIGASTSNEQQLATISSQGEAAKAGEVPLSEAKLEQEGGNGSSSTEQSSDGSSGDEKNDRPEAEKDEVEDKVNEEPSRISTFRIILYSLWLCVVVIWLLDFDNAIIKNITIGITEAFEAFKNFFIPYLYTDNTPSNVCVGKEQPCAVPTPNPPTA